MQNYQTMQSAKQSLKQSIFFFVFFIIIIFRENKYWHFMRIICLVFFFYICLSVQTNWTPSPTEWRYTGRAGPLLFAHQGLISHDIAQFNPCPAE